MIFEEYHELTNERWCQRMTIAADELFHEFPGNTLVVMRKSSDINNTGFSINALDLAERANDVNLSQENLYDLKFLFSTDDVYLLGDLRKAAREYKETLNV